MLWLKKDQQRGKGLWKIVLLYFTHSNFCLYGMTNFSTFLPQFLLHLMGNNTFWAYQWWTALVMSCGSLKSFAAAYCVTIFLAISLFHNITLQKTQKGMKMDKWSQVSFNSEYTYGEISKNQLPFHMIIYHMKYCYVLCIWWSEFTKAGAGIKF